MKKKLATVALTVACGLHSYAQQDSLSMTVDLKSAISSALQQNKQLQASQLDRDLYYQKVREARSSGLPQASASLTGTSYFGKSLSFSGMSIEMENSWTLSASATWTFALQQIAGVKLAKIAQEVAEQSVLSTELDVKANVTDTYYAVLLYERQLGILKQNMQDMEEIARHTERQYEVGYCELTDVDQIQVNVLTLRNSIISIERSLETTKRLLVLQMGIPIMTNLQTTETIDDLMESNAQPDSSKFDIENNIDYKTLKLSREVNEQTVKVRKYAYIPTVTGSYTYNHAFKGGFMTFDHVGAIVINVPIFSGFQRHSQLQQAKIEVQRTDYNMALMEDNLAQNAEQYMLDLQTAVDEYNLQKENLEVARRVLNNYKNKYNNGALSSLNLTQANSNYLTAETSYATACLNLMTAETKLMKLYNAFPY